MQTSIHAGPLALVTGASSGIGAEAALLLAKRGYRTVLIARRRDRLQAVAERLSEWAPSVAVAIDLNERDQLPLQLQLVLARHGPVDVLFNNAGFGQYRTFLETDERAHREMFEVHYFATVAMIREVLPAMLERRRGHVINMASMSTKMGPWGHSAYAAAKSAIVGLTQALAAEYEHAGVHFSYVNPGIIETEFFDTGDTRGMRRLVQCRGISPRRVARGIVNLLDQPQLELCVPRSYRVVDLLRAISPRWTHRLVASQSRPGESADRRAPESAAKPTDQSGSCRGVPGSRG